MFDAPAVYEIKTPSEYTAPCIIHVVKTLILTYGLSASPCLLSCFMVEGSYILKNDRSELNRIHLIGY